MTPVAAVAPIPDLGAPPGLWVGQLTLTSYRNHVQTQINCDGRPVVLAGPNGAGKTNILEALSALGPGRGLRGAKLGEAMRRADGAAPQCWTVAARVGLEGREVHIGTALDDAEKRQVRIDGEKAGPADLGAVLRLLWLTPTMDRLFTDSPGARRRFLDRLVLGLHAGHGRHVMTYEQAARQRAKLLADDVAEPKWLEALELRMAEHGAAITKARSHVLARLSAAIEDASDTAFPRAVLALDTGHENALEENDLHKALVQNRRRDQAAGRVTLGPARAELYVRHRAKDMPAADCSTGEQKALLIGLVLANTRLQAVAHGGAAPILLLDEVAAHLDAERRAALFDEICALKAQAWMTGTDSHLFDALGPRAQHFTVNDGSVFAPAGEQ